MSHKREFTHAQNVFLRSFRDHPAGPPASQWPSPAILRRWMRRPRFCMALRSIRDALRLQSDLHLASAAAQAASALQTSIDPGPAGEPATAAQVQAGNGRIHAMVQLLRLAHLRIRFTVDPEGPESHPLAMLNALKTVHKNLPVGRALELLNVLTADDDERPAYAGR